MVLDEELIGGMHVLPIADAEELAWQEQALCAQTDPEAFSRRRVAVPVKPSGCACLAMSAMSAWNTPWPMTSGSESGEVCLNGSDAA